LVSLDFNLYSGLYRGARLIIKDRLHITDPILADAVAGGGVFVTFPEVSKEKAIIQVRTQVKNADEVSRKFSLQTKLVDPQGKTVSLSISSPENLPPGAGREIVQEIHLLNPALWSPGSPSLYQVRSELVDSEKVL